MDIALLKIIQVINEILLHDRIVVSVWTKYLLDDIYRYYHFSFKIPNKDYETRFTISEEQFKDKDVCLVVSNILESVKNKLYEQEAQNDR